MQHERKRIADSVRELMGADALYRSALQSLHQAIRTGDRRPENMHAVRQGLLTATRRAADAARQMADASDMDNGLLAAADSMTASEQAVATMLDSSRNLDTALDQIITTKLQMAAAIETTTRRLEPQLKAWKVISDYSESDKDNDAGHD